jgi:hypothetical protein
MATQQQKERFKTNVAQFVKLKEKGKLNGEDAGIKKDLKSIAGDLNMDFSRQLDLAKKSFNGSHTIVEKDKKKRPGTGAASQKEKLGGQSFSGQTEDTENLGKRENPDIQVESKEGTGDVYNSNRSDQYWEGDSIHVDFKVRPWHVNPEKAAEEFSLKGIEFGNWLNEQERTEYLAKSMQGLHHLTRILGIDHSQAGLNEKLGIAFGARGRGGAMAHYEPNPTPVINLTKNKGQNSLAHEYGHALDNALAPETNHKWITGGQSTSRRIDEKRLKANGLVGLAEKIFKTLYYTKSGEKSDYYHRLGEGTDYERRRIEVFARCVDQYFTIKCKKNDIPTDYLCHKFSGGGVTPTTGEMKTVLPLFDRFFEDVFQKVEKREAPKGRAGSEKQEDKSPKGTGEKQEGQNKDSLSGQPLPANALIGDKTTVDFKADGSVREQGCYALAEVSRVEASHNKDCSPNSSHTISRSQPRDRSKDALCAQPNFIANHLNPASITEGNLAFVGTPVTTENLQDIQGNGRTIALKIAYDEIPSSAKKYKNYLIKHAADWGFTKADVKHFRQPVLVRVLPVSTERALELGNIVDTSQAKMSKIDQAKAYIRNLDESQLQTIGRLIQGSGGETIGQIIDDVGMDIIGQLTQLDRTGIVESNKLTSEGKDFLRSVLVGLVFDSEAHPNALHYYMKLPHTIKAGLERSFGYIIPLIGNKGDIRGILSKAVEIAAQVSGSDAMDAASDYTASKDMFEKKDFTKQETALAQFLLDQTTQKAIRNAFRYYDELLKGKKTLFGETKPKPKNKAFKIVFIDRQRPNPDRESREKVHDLIVHAQRLENFGHDNSDDLSKLDYLLGPGGWKWNSENTQIIRHSDEIPALQPKEAERSNPKELTPEVKRAVLDDFWHWIDRNPLMDYTPGEQTFQNWIPYHYPGYEGSAAEIWKIARPMERENPVTFIETREGELDFGEISTQLAEQINRQAGKIRLTKTGFDHVKDHKDQIEEIGFDDVLVFVEEVASHFNAIYADRGALLITIKNKPSKMAAVRLEPFRDNDFYVIKTALPIRSTYFKNKKLLWERAPSNHRKNAAPGAVSGHNSWKAQDKQNAGKRKNPDETAQFYSLEQSYTPEAYKSSRPQAGAGFNQLQDTKNLIKRENPKADLIYLGISKKLVIDQPDGPVTLQGPQAMMTNKAMNKLFLANLSDLNGFDENINDKKADEAFEEWNSYKTDGTNFSLDWPDNAKSVPVGNADEIIYLSDKIMQPQDSKGTEHTYRHDFDSGKRPAVKKGNVLIINNLKINQRGILN